MFQQIPKVAKENLQRRLRGEIPRRMGGTGRKNPHGSYFPWGLRFYSVLTSHSALWASHHAGKLGSFGERVGLT